jgi:DHA3 family tetracycline resistance protein-like MFS transporter
MFRIGFRRLSAPAAYYTQEGAAAFVFGLVFTIQAVYFVQTLGLTPLQLVLIGTVLELTCFLFEIPTGVIADTYSRRLSVVLGFACLGVGFLVLGFVPTFVGALLAQIVGGLGYTFLSGAQSAWITDEVGEEHVGRLFLRGSQVASVLGMLGVIVSALVGGLDVRLPIMAGGVSMVLLALTLAVFMPERGFTPSPREDRASWQAMNATFREGVRVVRRSRVLTGLLVVALMYGASTEALDRLWQYHLLRGVGLPDAFGLRPAHWFGLIGLLGSFLGLFAVEAIRCCLDLASVPPPPARSPSSRCWE